VAHRRLVHLLWRETDQFLVGCEPPESPHQRGGLVIGTGDLDGLGDQPLPVGQRLIQLTVVGRGSEPAREGKPGTLREVQVRI
jgi:hypothetical protein